MRTISAMPISQNAEIDAFLEIDGIKGEALDHKHRDQIQIESYSWGAHQRDPSPGRKLRTGVSRVENLQLVKRVDRSSPAILQALCLNRNFSKVTLFTRRAGGGIALSFLEIELSEVVVASWNLSATKNGGIPVEEFSLAFTKCLIRYRPQSAEGSPAGGPIEFSYNISNASD